MANDAGMESTSILYEFIINGVVHFTLSHELLTPKTINFKINVKELKFEKSN